MQAAVQILNAAWSQVWAVLPLMLLVAALCRWLPLRPATRHSMWVVVLVWLAAPLLLFALPWRLSLAGDLRNHARQALAELADARFVTMDHHAPAEPRLPAALLPAPGSALNPDTTNLGAAAESGAEAETDAETEARDVAVVAMARGSDAPRTPVQRDGVGEARDGAALRGSNSHAGHNDGAAQNITAFPGSRSLHASQSTSAGGVVNDAPQPAALWSRSQLAWRPVEDQWPGRRSEETGPPAHRIEPSEHTIPEFGAGGPPPLAAPRAAPSAERVGSLSAPGARLESAEHAVRRADRTGGDEHDPPQPLLPRLRQTLRTWLTAGLIVLAFFQQLPALPAFTWLCGSLAILLFSSARVLAFRRRIARSLPAPEFVRRDVARISRQIGLRRAPEVRLVRGAISPLVWCWGGVTLFLPEALWAQLDRVGRKAILCHELAHVRRRDHWICWLDLLVGAMYWWHPLVWWVRRRLHDEADHSCDAWVTWLMPRRRRAYAEALLVTRQFVSQSPTDQPLGAIAVTSAAARNMRRRLTMVMTQVARPRSSSPGMLFAVILLVAGAVVAPSLSCPPGEEEGSKNRKAPVAAIVTNEAGQASAATANGSAPVAAAGRAAQRAAEAAKAAAEAADNATFAEYMRAQQAEKERAAGGAGLSGTRARSRSGARSGGGSLGGDDAIISRSYALPEGKLDDFYKLMVRDDVPVRVSKGAGEITIQATAAQHEAIADFLSACEPNDNWESYNVSNEEKGEALSTFMARPDVAIFVQPGSPEIRVQGNARIQQIFKRFLDVIDAGQTRDRPRRARAGGISAAPQAAPPAAGPSGVLMPAPASPPAAFMPSPRATPSPLAPAVPGQPGQPPRARMRLFTPPAAPAAPAPPGQGMGGATPEQRERAAVELRRAEIAASGGPDARARSLALEEAARARGEARIARDEAQRARELERLRLSEAYRSQRSYNEARAGALRDQAAALEEQVESLRKMSDELREQAEQLREQLKRLRDEKLRSQLERQTDQLGEQAERLSASAHEFADRATKDHEDADELDARLEELAEKADALEDEDADSDEDDSSDDMRLDELLQQLSSLNSSAGVDPAQRTGDFTMDQVAPTVEQATAALDPLSHDSERLRGQKLSEFLTRVGEHVNGHGLLNVQALFERLKHSRDDSREQ